MEYGHTTQCDSQEQTGLFVQYIPPVRVLNETQLKSSIVIGSKVKARKTQSRNYCYHYLVILVKADPQLSAIYTIITHNSGIIIVSQWLSLWVTGQRVRGLRLEVGVIIVAGFSFEAHCQAATVGP